MLSLKEKNEGIPARKLSEKDIGKIGFYCDILCLVFYDAVVGEIRLVQLNGQDTFSDLSMRHGVFYELEPKSEFVYVGE